MLADSGPNNECDHSQNWVTVGKAKQNKGESEMGKHPPGQEELETTPVHLSDMEYSYPPEEGSSPPVEGWLYTLLGR